MRDIRFAARALWRSPTFTFATVLALGLAIGSTGAIFSLVDGLWLRPPGVRDPNALVWVFSTSVSEHTGAWSYPHYEALRDRTTAFDGVAARGRRGAMFIDASGRPDLVLVNVVSTNFFTTLGVRAIEGRLFAPGDDQALEREPGVVLGHAFWTKRFGADPAIVGQTVQLGRGKGHPVRVLGVLPATFRELTTAADRDLWMPPQTWIYIAGRGDLEQPDYRWFEIVARQRGGASRQSAEAEVVTLASALARELPSGGQGRSARIVSDFDYRVERGGVNAAGLLALMLLVVLITCVNVANLLLARTADRTRELAVRIAIGAGRWHLVRHLAAESLLLGASGAVFSLLVTLWLIRLLPALMRAPPGFQPFTRFEGDLRVVGFTIAITAVTTLLFSLGPIWAAMRTDVAKLIKTMPISVGGGSGGRLRNGLVVGQVAISMVLVSSAAVLGRSFVETTRVDLGFTRAPVLTAWISPVDLTPATGAAAVERLSGLPGVGAVAIALRAPLSLSGGGMAQPVAVPGERSYAGDSWPEVKFTAVSSSYFTVMDTRLIEGRFFSRDEESAGEPVVVINEAFAAMFFTSGSAVGRVMRPGGRAAPDHRVVGVARNAVINEIGERREPYFYVPYWRERHSEITFLVRAHDPPPIGLPAQIGHALKATEPQLEPRRGVIPMSGYIEYSASTYEATAALASGLAAIGLFLTAIGVYGVIAYRTSRRVKEIGIRVALGAPRSQVMRLVLRDGVRVALFGLALGLPAALVAMRLLESILFGVDPWDGTALVSAAVALCLAVGLATFFPAWRAARLTPSSALREG